MAGACFGLAAKEDERETGLKSNRKVARQLLLEGDWVQQRLFIVGWSNESDCQVTKKKTQKSRGSTIVHNGKGSEGRPQRLSESGSKKQGLQRKSGTGKEVSSRILSANASGTEGISV